MVYDWSKMQKSVSALIQSFGGISITITSLPDPTTQQVVTTKTIGVFDNGQVKNIDNRQNPTVIGGQVGQVLYVPGDLKQDPDVGGQVSYKANGKNYVKRISQVNCTQPTDTALLYVLSLE